MSDPETSTSENSTLEEMFKDRYTNENERYKKITEGFEKVVIVHPWNPRQFHERRNFDNNRGRGGGFRGRGGGYNNSRGGGYNNQWRGGNNGGSWRGGNSGGSWRDGDRKRNYDNRN